MDKQEMFELMVKAVRTVMDERKADATMTIKEAASYLGVSAVQVYRLINDKKLHKMKNGRRTLLSSVEVRALVK